MGYKYNNLIYEDENYLVCSGPASFFIKEADFHPNTKLIQPYAFSRSDIEKVNFPDDIECLAGHAFSDCKRLEYIDLSNTNVQLVEGCFEGCSRLEYFKAPKHKQESLHSTFMNCDSLKHIDLSNMDVRILENTFNRCKNLESVILPKKLEMIKGLCFANTSLKNIDLPNSIYFLDGEIFTNTKLSNIILPSDLRYLNDFLWGSNIKNLYYKKDINEYALNTIKEYIRVNEYDVKIQNIDLDALLDQNKSLKEINKIFKDIER